MFYNKTTLLSYEKNIDKYINLTPKGVSGDFKNAIDSFLKLLTQDSLILEIGSGTGRDADYIESKGFNITRTDASNSFIEYQKQKGKDILKLDLLNMSSFRNKNLYDLIFANAVFLHFDTKEFIQIMGGLKLILKDGGYIAFSVKKGTGTEWSNHKLNAKRFYKYWNEKELSNNLLSIGFDIISTKETIDEKWLFYIVQKN